MSPQKSTVVQPIADTDDKAVAERGRTEQSPGDAGPRIPAPTRHNRLELLLTERHERQC
jgi:hypothetical protein